MAVWRLFCLYCDVCHAWQSGDCSVCIVMYHVCHVWQCGDCLVSIVMWHMTELCLFCLYCDVIHSNIHHYKDEIEQVHVPIPGIA